MKKQIKKLNLSKRTISNLDSLQMNKKIGGAPTANCNGHTYNNQKHTCTLCTHPPCVL